jgi:CDP-diglyceride synthetase
MYAGAAVSTVTLIIWLAIAVGDIQAAARGRWLGHSLTAARLSQLKPLIVTVLMVGGLVVIALWLWLARAVGQGRNWARILSTVLLGLATLELADLHGAAQASWAMLAWLTGLAAVWQLWRPASSAFFERCRPAA